MGRIDGIGKVKLARYGRDFLEVIGAHATPRADESAAPLPS